MSAEGILVFTLHGRTALWVLQHHTLKKTRLSPQQRAAIRLEFEPANKSLSQKYGVNLEFSDPAAGE